MPTTLPMLILAAVLAQTADPAVPAEPATPDEPRVTIELLSDAPALGPGGVWLGVRLAVPEGWHVYWENPGESGMKTAAEFHAPEGFEVGPARYPGPDVFVQPGDVVGYGYQDAAMLLTRVTPTADAPVGGPVVLTVDASWLACKHICIPGTATAALELPRSVGPVLPSSPDPLAAFREDLPQPLEAQPGASLSWSRDEEGPVATVHLPGAVAVLAFPSVELEMKLRQTLLYREGDGIEFAIQLRDGAEEPLRVVLAVRGPDRDRYLELALTPPTL